MNPICRCGRLVLALVSATCGCAPVQRHETIQQPVGVRLSAEIGSPLFHIDRTSDLPNAFGNADLFGGKVDAGTVDLIFAGMAPSGEMRFRLVEMNTRSSETTMSRYGRTQVHATTTDAPTAEIVLETDDNVRAMEVLERM